MNCPSCGAPMQLKADAVSFRCDYCHAVYVPPTEQLDEGVRVLGDPTTQSCPVCSTPLVNAAVQKIRIVYCTHCHGMLVPMGALQGLIDAEHNTHASSAAPAATDPDDLKRKLACPGCRHPMDAHFYAGGGNVIVNSCEDCCLIWLDNGSLTRIAHAAGADASGTQYSEPAFDADQDLGRDPDQVLSVDNSFVPGQRDPNTSLIDAIGGLLQTITQMQR
jgi:LSD1 subclass zinc finger protein